MFACRRIGFAREGARERKLDIAQRPATDDAVIGKHDEGADRAAPADQCPETQGPVFGNQGTHGVDRALTAHAAKHDFRDQDGECNGQGGHRVDENKGTAAILTRQIRKAPDVAETHGTADGGHQKGEMRRPLTRRKGCRHA